MILISRDCSVSARERYAGKDFTQAELSTPNQIFGTGPESHQFVSQCFREITYRIPRLNASAEFSGFRLYVTEPEIRDFGAA